MADKNHENSIACDENNGHIGGMRCNKVTERQQVRTTSCTECNQSPCYLIQMRSSIKSLFKRFDNDTRAPNLKRKEMYQLMTAMVHGRPLGKGNRIPLPSCLVRAVRKTFPRTAKCPKYMGYKYK